LGLKPSVTTALASLHFHLGFSVRHSSDSFSSWLQSLVVRFARVLSAMAGISYGDEIFVTWRQWCEDSVDDQVLCSLAIGVFVILDEQLNCIDMFSEFWQNDLPWTCSKGKPGSKTAFFQWLLADTGSWWRASWHWMTRMSKVIDKWPHDKKTVVIPRCMCQTENARRWCHLWYIRSPLSVAAGLTECHSQLGLSRVPSIEGIHWFSRQENSDYWNSQFWEPSPHWDLGLPSFVIGLFQVQLYWANNLLN
jgi:hypothetical protein